MVSKDIHVRPGKSRCDKGEEVYEGESTRASLFQTFGTYLGFCRTVSERVPSRVSPSTQRYMETLELAPGLKKLLGDGKLVDHIRTENSNLSFVHTASDYSYSSDRYSGDGWRIIGDAGGR